MTPSLTNPEKRCPSCKEKFDVALSYCPHCETFYYETREKSYLSEEHQHDYTLPTKKRRKPKYPNGIK